MEKMMYNVSQYRVFPKLSQKCNYVNSWESPEIRSRWKFHSNFHKFYIFFEIAVQKLSQKLFLFKFSKWITKWMEIFGWIDVRLSEVTGFNKSRIKSVLYFRYIWLMWWSITPNVLMRVTKGLCDCRDCSEISQVFSVSFFYIRSRSFFASLSIFISRHRCVLLVEALMKSCSCSLHYSQIRKYTRDSTPLACTCCSLCKNGLWVYVFLTVHVTVPWPACNVTIFPSVFLPHDAKFHTKKKTFFLSLFSIVCC